MTTLFNSSPSGYVIGIDEVGRGALAGPVCVGAAAIDRSCGDAPQGLTDSKCLRPLQRKQLYDPIIAWTKGCAVGCASSQEIDRWGIIVALRLAGRRALKKLRDRGIDTGAILLDGSHNWLALPPRDLFMTYDHPDNDRSLPVPNQIVTQVKADQHYAVVSAASVVAKVDRDNLMCELDSGPYDWKHNKGYASGAHIQALREHGPSPLHRLSWKLPS
ncbi:MAG: ribonuclease HII [Actinomycetaceae bacterium]|nr:ribonuclease HII [Actinomycetaceae bacterium]